MEQRIVIDNILTDNQELELIKICVSSNRTVKNVYESVMILVLDASIKGNSTIDLMDLGIIR